MIGSRQHGGHRRVALALLTLSGCGPSLAPGTIGGHPGIRLEPAKPAVVEASEPRPPAWIATSSTTVPGRWAFIGQASASTLKAAEDAAHQDLLRAITEFVEVRVEHEHESISEHRSDDNGVEEREVSLEESRSRSNKSQSIAQGTEIADRYWERVAIAARPASYRSYLRAWVDTGLVERARLESRLSSERGRGRRIVVIQELKSKDPTLGHAITAELHRRLVEVPGLTFTGPLPAPLCPDLEIHGRVEQIGPALRIRYSIVPNGEPTKAIEKTVEGLRSELFDLEDRFALAVVKDLERRAP